MDYTLYLRAILSLAFVLGLLLFLSWVVRRFGLAGALGGTPLARGNLRLGVVESLPLDTKRKLILVRRDGVEHLLVVGLAGETVIETGIRPPQGGITPPPFEAIP